ncbi:hypothetical protein B0H12DRAFT_1107424 [Mycena haematopus]|nr:hypothetical protein B0H12DRAFT_1107424 [Mycena haematopus]
MANRSEQIAQCNRHVHRQGSTVSEEQVADCMLLSTTDEYGVRKHGACGSKHSQAVQTKAHDGTPVPLSSTTSYSCRREVELQWDHPMHRRDVA